MKSFLVLFSLCCFLVASAVGANSAIPPSRVEIVIDEDFDLPSDPGNAHRSIPLIPFSAFLNDNHSIDLEFYQSIGEVEIVISQGGIVILSYSEEITSPALKNIQLHPDESGEFLLEIKGENGGYAFGWFIIH